MFDRYKVERDTLRGFEDWDEMEAVLKEFAKKLRVNIEVSIPHHTSEPVESRKGVLFIKNYCCAEGGRSDTYSIPSAYGFSLGSDQEDAMEPSKTLFTLYDEEGVAVAELAPGCIFVLFDLPHGGNSGQLIRSIMDDYSMFVESEEEFARVVSKRITEASFKNFSNIFDNQLKSLNQNMDNSISEIEEMLRYNQREIIQKMRELDHLHKKRRVNTILLDEYSPKILIDKYEALKKLAVNGEIEVDHEKIKLFVGQIDIEFKGKVYDIGEFDIEIFPDGDHGGVRCINRTCEVDNNYHPHVDNDGECCLGNISDSIAMLIGTMEYDIAVIMMMQFLRSCYEDGWMQDVTDWPLKNGGFNGEEN